MWDVHTTDAPIRHFGCYHDALIAEHVRARYAAVLHQTMVVDEVTVEPWQAHLLPTRLADLPEEWEVWVAAVADHATGHRAGRSGTAPCGTPVLPTPICAGRLHTLHFGSLCVACWPSAGWPV